MELGSDAPQATGPGSWTTLHSHVTRDTTDLGVCDLTSSWHFLRITASSSAGDTTVVYRVSTMYTEGGVLLNHTCLQENWNWCKPMVWDNNRVIQTPNNASIVNDRTVEYKTLSLVEYQRSCSYSLSCYFPHVICSLPTLSCIPQATSQQSLFRRCRKAGRSMWAAGWMSISWPAWWVPFCWPLPSSSASVLPSGSAGTEAIGKSV